MFAALASDLGIGGARFLKQHRLQPGCIALPCARVLRKKHDDGPVSDAPVRQYPPCATRQIRYLGDSPSDQQVVRGTDARLNARAKLLSEEESVRPCL